MDATAPDQDDLLIADVTRTTRGQTTIYKYIVGLLRVVLGVSILGVIAAVFLWPELTRVDPPPALAPDEKTATNELVNPRFESMDGDSQPYQLTAARARQRDSNSDIIDLETPKGTMTFADQTALTLSAQNGVYTQSKKIMNLTGSVTLTTNTGYVFTSEMLDMDLTTKKIHSDRAVAGKGPAGSVTATGVDGDGNLGILVFKGPATLILTQEDMQ